MEVDIPDFVEKYQKIAKSIWGSTLANPPGEDRAGFVVERAVAILTPVPLKLSIAAVLDHRLTAAARALEAIAPADLSSKSAALACDLNTVNGNIASG